jgi:hypothetical protein
MMATMVQRNEANRFHRRSEARCGPIPYPIMPSAHPHTTSLPRVLSVKIGACTSSITSGTAPSRARPRPPVRARQTSKPSCIISKQNVARESVWPQSPADQLLAGLIHADHRTLCIIGSVMNL